MKMTDLSICFPKQKRGVYREIPNHWPEGAKYKLGDIPKTHIPADATIVYQTVTLKSEPRGTAYYYGADEHTHFHERLSRNPNVDSMTLSQDLRKTDQLSVKINKASSYGKEYSSTHILDKETGLESVVRQKGKEVIGGYEILPVKRTFAEGLKGRLQKMGMAVATDANGCERPVLKNIGEMILKVAKRIK